MSDPILSCLAPKASKEERQKTKEISSIFLYFFQGTFSATELFISRLTAARRTDQVFDFLFID
jgi:hypothetical protein